MYTVNETYEIRPPVDEQEATADGLISVVEDRPVVRLPNLADEFCARCDEIFSVYMEANRKPDSDLRSGRLRDGDRIRFFAVFDADPDDGYEMQGWKILAIHHHDHIEKDREDGARPGLAQATATARIDQCGVEYENHILCSDGAYQVEEGCVLRDVKVEWFSPIGDGDDSERYPDREPDEDGRVVLERTDPRPNFPDALNLWRCGILMENDAWFEQDGVDY